MSIPQNIQERIIIDCIILEKNRQGWKSVHDSIINFKKHKNTYSVNDVYSMDEYGNYLDDLCDEYFSAYYDDDDDDDNYNDY